MKIVDRLFESASLSKYTEWEQGTFYFLLTIQSYQRLEQNEDNFCEFYGNYKIKWDLKRNSTTN